MSRIVVINHVTLDGVMQAPGRPDEDDRDGFAHGGWGAAHADQAVIAAQGKEMGPDWRLLLGRRTYEDFFAVWPKRPESPFSEALTNARKYVASTTLRDPLPWSNSALLGGDAIPAVARLREEPGGNIVVMGSGELIRSLMGRGLVDRWVLITHPLTLGSGRRLFAEGIPPTTLQLADSVTTSTGVVIGIYEPAEDNQARGGTDGDR